MTESDMIVLAKAAAVAHNLPPALVCAVAEWESGGWQPFAMRYEPAFERRYDPVDATKQPTEHYARAVSWGLMQVMGETARELGFTGNYLSQL